MMLATLLAVAPVGYLELASRGAFARSAVRANRASDLSMSALNGRRVVVTGMGIVSCLGNTLDDVSICTRAPRGHSPAPRAVPHGQPRARAHAIFVFGHGQFCAARPQASAAVRSAAAPNRPRVSSFRCPPRSRRPSRASSSTPSTRRSG